MDMKKLLAGITGCECGMDHRCAIEAVEVGEGALARIPALLGDCRRVMLVHDRNTKAAAGAKVLSDLRAQGFEVAECLFDTAEVVIPDEASIAVLEGALPEGAQAIVGVGSGVVNDLCKYVSAAHSLPYMIVATAPSMDGFASVGAAMILGGMKVTTTARVPRWIVGDSAVLAKAPLPMIRAGLGDVLGKYSCLNDWKLAHIITGERLCRPVYELVMGEVKRCADHVEAVMARDVSAIGELMESLVIVGIGMAYMGNSRPASGSEHHFSHFFEITGILNGEKYLPHGIDVAYSTLLTCQIREMLAQEDPARFAHAFDEAAWRADVGQVYGSLAPSVEALQEKVGFYRTDRAQTIRDKWPQIVEALREVPTRAQVEALLGKAGYRYEEFRTLYGEEKLRRAVEFAKDLKDRYTVLWLLQDVGLLHEYAREMTL